MAATTTICTVLLLCVCVFADPCMDKTDGNYQISCRSYLVCHNKHATLHNCPDPPNPHTVYNMATGMCDDPKNVSAPCGVWQDCSNKPDKRFADVFNNCTSYYTCQNAVFFGHNLCTPGMVFDEAKQLCNWPRDVPPPCGTLKPPKPTVTA